MLSSQRSQTFISLHLGHGHLEEARCIFYILALLKSSRTEFQQQPLEFRAYGTDKSLFIVRLIDNNYLKQRKKLRCGHSSAFFITYDPLRKKVTS